MSVTLPLGSNLTYPAHDHVTWCYRAMARTITNDAVSDDGFHSVIKGTAKAGCAVRWQSIKKPNFFLIYCFTYNLNLSPSKYSHPLLIHRAQLFFPVLERVLERVFLGSAKVPYRIFFYLFHLLKSADTVFQKPWNHPLLYIQTPTTTSLAGQKSVTRWLTTSVYHTAFPPSCTARHLLAVPHLIYR